MVNKRVGVCAAGIHELSINRLLNAICDEAKTRDYDVRVYAIFSDLYFETQRDIAQRKIFNLIENSRLDALIIFAESIHDPAVREHLVDVAGKANIPVIGIKSDVPGCCNIKYDAIVSIREIIEHLILVHNCRKINFITGIKGNPIAMERLAIYREMLEAHGIPVEEERIGYGDFWDEPTRKVMDHFMKSELPRPDAIVCANDAMGIAVVDYLNERGIRTPEDIIVTGMGGIKEREHHFPLLTTGIYDPKLAGQTVFNAIEGILDGSLTQNTEILIPCKVIYDESCGCRKRFTQKLEHKLERFYEEHALERNYLREVQGLITTVNAGCNFETLVDNLPRYTQKPGLISYNVYLNSEYAESAVSGFELPVKDYPFFQLNSYINGENTLLMKPLDRKGFDASVESMDVDTSQIALLPIVSENDYYGIIAFCYHSEQLKYELLFELMQVLNIAVDTIITRFKFDTIGRQLKEVSEMTILSLAEIVEAKSEYTGFHVKRVSEYTRILAEAAGYDDEEVNVIRIASMMHDIGKLNIPSEILEKPGKLTPEEFDIIKTHVTEGARMLEKSPGKIMQTACRIALQHHEKWNGTGYLGMKGEEISKEARIVAVADVFDALVSERPYKKAFSAETAYDIIVGDSGTHFDPQVVEYFILNFDKFKEVMESYRD